MPSPEPSADGLPDVSELDNAALRRLAKRRGFLLVKNFHQAALRRGYFKATHFHRTALERGYIRVKRFHRAATERGYVRELGLGEVMAAQQFAVDEVLDVGVMSGTEWLYDLYSHARFVLVEPIPDGEQLLKWRPDDYVFANCGAGSESGELVLNRYNNDMLTSFLDLHNIAEGEDVSEKRQLAEQVTVPVRTLDDLIEEHCTSDRIGIKIDVEGFELEAVRGLDKHKERVVFIVAEASVRRRHEGSYQFSDLVAELRDRGFLFLNVLNEQSRSPQFFDTLFVQQEDPRLEAPVGRIDDLEERDREARARALARR
jgi:FkbM family methyltransferase